MVRAACSAQGATMSGPDVLEAWTLYDSPVDARGYFVMRRWVIKRGKAVASPEAYWCKEAEPLRNKMRKRGLTRMDRHPDDEPHIVETWI